MDEELLEELIYEQLCKNCYHAKRCHDDCEFCEKFNDELEKRSINND